MFEHRHQPLITRVAFVQRLVNHVVLALGLIASSLVIGVLGYHCIAGLAWIDAFENAAMILSGMGPVNEIDGNAAKIFAGCYAMFSGVVFLSTAAILFAPLAHRLLHHFHLQRRAPAGDDGAGQDGDYPV